jgi:hypothetical protein
MYLLFKFVIFDGNGIPGCISSQELCPFLLKFLHISQHLDGHLRIFGSPFLVSIPGGLAAAISTERNRVGNGGEGGHGCPLFHGREQIFSLFETNGSGSKKHTAFGNGRELHQTAAQITRQHQTTLRPCTAISVGIKSASIYIYIVTLLDPLGAE